MRRTDTARALAAVCLPVAALALVTGCSTNTDTGTIVGTLERVGGPAPGAPVPLHGRVVVVASTGARFLVSVGKSGRFKVSLSPGRYYLSGYSPMVRSDGAEMRCSAPHAVRVVARKLTPNIRVVCSIR